MERGKFWRIQKDVESWIMHWMNEKVGKEPGEATARRYASEFIAAVSGGSQGSQV
jgi:hypothetical protein